MGDISTILLAGGPTALILAVGLAIKYAVQGFTGWRRSDDDNTPRPRTATDAATTNALMLESLRSEREESARKDTRIDELEAEVDSLRSQLWEQRRTYEQEIGDLRSKIQDVTIQLEALQARIQAGLPDLHHD